MKTTAPFAFGFVLLICSCSGENESIDQQVREQNESSTELSETSEITCPYCEFTKTETLPTEVCQIVYECTNCGNKLTPNDGDCCVFCSHGSHTCPSVQEESSGPD